MAWQDDIKAKICNGALTVADVRNLGEDQPHLLRHRR